MNWKIKALITSVGLLLTTAVHAADVRVKGTHIHDHYKNQIHQQPYVVQVCYDKKISGDKTGDTLKGALIGGILGKAITGDDDGAKVGALFGGIVGHEESKTTSGTRTICEKETRYKETTKKIYSHSTIVFVYEGIEYKVRFQK